MSPQTNHSVNYDYSEVATSPNSSPDNTQVWPQTQINNLLSLPNTSQIEINIPNIPIPNDENDNYINNDDIVYPISYLFSYVFLCRCFRGLNSMALRLPYTISS